MVGSDVVCNTKLATDLGLASNWITRRTGIDERRVCADGEDVMSLGTDAVQRACADAGLSTQELGNETVLLHVQLGPVGFMPSAAARLAGQLGLADVRFVGFDGVCAEPIVAFETALLMLHMRSARRAIVSTSADFGALIDRTDPTTTGLFGAGAGALVLEAEEDGEPASTVHGLHWVSHPQHNGLGHATILRDTRLDSHVQFDVGYYTMDGQRLAKLAVRVLPDVIKPVLDEAGWTVDDVDLVISHQPNVRMLETGVRALGFDASIVPMPVRQLGNLGPASLLVTLSLARDEGKLPPGTKVLLVAFGLGFSCGAAAVEI